MSPNSESPWHAGERRLQDAYGVGERMEVVGARVIRDFMPDQHRTFYAALPFLVLGSVDAAGRPWATLLEGSPGFAQSPDPHTLEIQALPPPGDPAGAGLAAGESVGLLGIELPTRRRNRMNGRVAQRDATGFSVTVEQAFGNCPQYIQRRELEPGHPDTPVPGAGATVETLAGLDAAARATLTAADTFFVASYVDGEGRRRHRAVDVSHRGGRPGFVRVEGDRLTIPDFAGNLQFNTLGNLIVNPRAGLVFVDFESGDLLQLSGRTELVIDPRAAAAHPGAERIWSLDVEAAVRRRGVLGLRFGLRDFSPKTLLTGTWNGIGS
ncbi:pyridoxamine 5'-phosphate oxidase family protein [Myxococcota bacterium]|nr:pyridoxamine 5'-phosphate oxidase family protein [Myxococcota bacterium]